MPDLTPAQICLRMVKQMCRAYQGDDQSEGFRDFLLHHYHQEKATLTLMISNNVSPATLKSQYLGLSIPASGLLAFGQLDVGPDIIESVGASGNQAPDALIYRLGMNTLRLLLPLPAHLSSDRTQPQVLRIWFQDVAHQLIWNEAQGRYGLQLL